MRRGGGRRGSENRSGTHGTGSRFGPREVREAVAAIGPATWSELIRHLEPRRGQESRAFRRAVDVLLDSGEIARSRQGAYQLAAGREKVTGTVAREAGRLWLHTDDKRALAIASGKRLRPGDRAGGFVEGKTVDIVRVAEPSSVPVVALLCSTRSRRPRWFAESLDPDLKGRIDLVDPPAARPGAVVEVHVLAVAGDVAEGRVLGVVEAGDEAAQAAEALLATHGIPRTWSFDPESLNMPRTVAAGERSGRRDLCDLPLVTIDGDEARDFDDAVFAEPRPRGGWRLVVAIADVAHYVKPGSALDRDARERGNSLYLPDRVVPMLPEALSNGICSLVPNQDRLAVACELSVSARGRVSGYRFFDAVIRSHARLTYRGVDGFLRGGKLDASADVAASVRTLHDVYHAFRERRDERGALDFDAREAVVVLQHGRPAGIEPVLRTDAHRLIEETMIAANVAAARCLEARRKAADSEEESLPPPIYRVHEPPSGDKLDILGTALRLAGERLPRGPLTPATLAETCARAQAKSPWPRWIWETIVLRALSQARYQPRRLGHFGLALPAYTHFTSPIRRYADLLNHRAIKGEVAAMEEWDAVAAHISMTERRAEDVERAVDAWLKCAVVEEHVGETFAGTVAGVTEFGIFVELDDLFVQGLVHISKLGRDYYHYMRETTSLVADRSGARFAMADRVEVVVEEVSVAAGRIDLALARGPRGRRRGRR